MKGADIWEVPVDATVAAVAAEIERERVRRERALRLQETGAPQGPVVGAEYGARGRVNAIANRRRLAAGGQ